MAEKIDAEETCEVPHHGFDAGAVRGLRGLIQNAAGGLPDRVQDTGRAGVSDDFAFLRYHRDAANRGPDSLPLAF